MFMVPHTDQLRAFPGSAGGLDVCSCLRKSIAASGSLLYGNARAEIEFFVPTPNVRDLLTVPTVSAASGYEVMSEEVALLGNSSKVYSRFLALCLLLSCLAAFFSQKACGLFAPFFFLFPSC